MIDIECDHGVWVAYKDGRIITTNYDKKLLMDYLFLYGYLERDF